ncbi:MAG TPA: chromosome segregation protein SMC, partial [Longimicrobiaceae bacterium]|nr:chromosome segregation protein SMC [Longimicrobiaceae bacterium]
IETLLSDRAEERRLLFEEAAGIGRYKDSRHAATRRLDAAEADLARLQDLIAEVEQKVRSLARQRKRAERHRELQDRRLALEVALARREVHALGEALAAAEKRHAEMEELGRAASTERTTAEALVEERRIESAQLVRERGAVAARLEALRSEIDAREREMLLADERRSHAELRIQQLVRERGEQEERRKSLARDAVRFREEAEGRRAKLQELRGRLELRAGENQEVRVSLAAERTASEAAAARARELAREIATTEGERLSADRQRREAEQRAAELDAQEEGLSGQLTQAAEQTELFTSRGGDVRASFHAATEAAERAREEVRALREREQTARDALRAAEDRLSRLVSQVEAREAVERGYEGFAPAVAAVMAARERFPGVHGPLADFVEEASGAHDAEAVDRYLGPLLQALVVDDLAAARAVRHWFRAEWTGGGSLLLLPLDAPGRAAVDAAHVSAWVDPLLADLVVVTDDPLAEHAEGRARIGPNGDVVDARGVVRLRAAEPGEGILSRREALAKLRVERDEAESDRDSRLGARESLREALAAAEATVVEAEEARRAAEAEVKRVEMEVAAHQHRHGHLERERERIAESLATLRTTATAAAERLTALERRLGELGDALENAGVDEAAARERLGALEGRWEEARDEESELRVSLARAEAELRETERRQGAAQHGGEAATRRVAAIDAEAAELRRMLEELSGVRERAGGDVEALFRRRDGEAARLSELDGALAAIEESLAALAERVRVARRSEGEAAEERHRLELERADLRSRAERAVERLEVEWGRPWAALADAATALEESGEGEWREELRSVVQQLDGLGPVNMLAVEEHAEEERRLTFLLEQRTDLVTARDDLVAAIRQINRTAREVFTSTFETVRENFQRVFQSLFQGGECDLRLADPDDPLESPVEIQASPKGKRTQRIHLLSGGERTLTALALLFALYLVKPSPFCVLDEVDAPLDESNVGRFLQLLDDFKGETQFIVITHNPRTMEAADWVYGVTMEEPGVSTIVGVEMDGRWKPGEHAAVTT